MTFNLYFWFLTFDFWITMQNFIYLEPDEEITSVVDKLGEAKEKSLGLVIPKGAAILQSVVNLKLLKKEAEKSGKEIAIITADKIGRNIAAQVGLTVYESTKSREPISIQPKPEIPRDEELEIDDTSVIRHEEKAEKIKQPEESEEIETPTSKEEEREVLPRGITVKRYDEGQNLKPKVEIKNVEESPRTEKQQSPARKRPLPSPLSRKIFLLGIPLLLIILGGIFLGYLLLPKATATLIIGAEDFSADSEITVDKAIDKIDQDKKAISGQEIEAESSDKKSFSATGKKNVGTKASGILTLYNSWDSAAQNFPAGTKFISSDGKNFSSTADAAIPGATTALKEGQIVTTAGKTTVNVEAEQAGEDYNVAAGHFTIASLPKDKQAKIYGESAAAMSGGTSKQVTILAENDIAKGKEDLSQELYAKNLDELKKKTKDLRLLESAVSNQIVDAKPSAKVGDEMENFELEVKTKSKALIFSDKNYRDLVIVLAKQNVPQGKDLMVSGQDEITTAVSNLNIANGTMLLKGQLKTKVGAQIEENEIKNKIAGRNIDEAKEILESLALVKEAQIKTKPSWLKKIPSREKNIAIKIEYK